MASQDPLSYVPAGFVLYAPPRFDVIEQAKLLTVRPTLCSYQAPIGAVRILAT